MEIGVQAFNIFNHVQLGDPDNLTLVYDPTVAGTSLQVPGSFGIVSSTVNFNNNNDNDAFPNIGYRATSANSVHASRPLLKLRQRLCRFTKLSGSFATVEIHK